jgi:hypothetical protein
MKIQRRPAMTAELKQPKTPTLPQKLPPVLEEVLQKTASNNTNNQIADFILEDEPKESTGLWQRIASPQLMFLALWIAIVVLLWDDFKAAFFN